MTSYEKAPKEFFLGGKCIFTVVDGKGDHKTFKIRHVEKTEKFPEMYKIGLLTGQDNTKDYTYFGKVDPETGYIKLFRKSKVKWTYDTLAVKVASYVLEMMWTGGTLAEGIRLQAPSRCSRCGRTLTAPPEQNPYFPWFGPECGSR